jgi:hypothetical protein
LRLGIHNNPKLQRAWNKYGKKNFVFSILKELPTVELANKWEQHYIDSYDSKNWGYNILDVTGGRKFTLEYTAFGKTQTLDKWSEEYPFTPKQIRARLTRGQSLEEALTNPPNVRTKTRRMLEFSGETKPLREWARQYNINENTLWYRLNRGMSLEASLIWKDNV